jgi:uncharacterized protein with PIN domain
MSAVTNILKLLDKIPVWKQLKDLPGKVTSLENRIAKLEKKLSGGDKICPECGSSNYKLKKTEVRDRFLGTKEKIIVCDDCKYDEPYLCF